MVEIGVNQEEIGTEEKENLEMMNRGMKGIEKNHLVSQSFGRKNFLQS